VSAPEFELTASARLRPLTEADADELYELIDSNRAYLARWMPWAEAQTRSGALEFIRTTREQATTDGSFQVALAVDGRIAGVLGYHSLDRENRRVSIGYWIAEADQGRGLMTRAVAALIEYAFDVWGLHRVEIRSAVENERSRALCERLGLVQEGVLRQAEAFTDRYHDLVVYSVLAPEWAQRRER
jgi:ribosomal-protein-serine acetyltransferase